MSPWIQVQEIFLNRGGTSLDGLNLIVVTLHKSIGGKLLGESSAGLPTDDGNDDIFWCHAPRWGIVMRPFQFKNFGPSIGISSIYGCCFPYPQGFCMFAPVCNPKEGSRFKLLDQIYPKRSLIHITIDNSNQDKGHLWNGGKFFVSYVFSIKIKFFNVKNEMILVKFLYSFCKISAFQMGLNMNYMIKYSQNTPVFQSRLVIAI